jgi:hypothetical protein
MVYSSAPTNVLRIKERVWFYQHARVDTGTIMERCSTRAHYAHCTGAITLDVSTNTVVPVGDRVRRIYYRGWSSVVATYSGGDLGGVAIITTQHYWR